MESCAASLTRSGWVAASSPLPCSRFVLSLSLSLLSLPLSRPADTAHSKAPRCAVSAAAVPRCWQFHDHVVYGISAEDPYTSEATLIADPAKHNAQSGAELRRKLEALQPPPTLILPVVGARAPRCLTARTHSTVGNAHCADSG